MNYSIFVLFVTFYCVSGSEILSNNDAKVPRCYNFTWLVDTYDEEKTQLNCSDPMKKNIPCNDKQTIVSLSEPNFTEIWSNKSTQSDYTCILKGMESCIKYTYRFNDAIINSTYFCAKAVEDMVTPITDGCFSQMTEGHVIEVCICRSTGLGIPCNSSIKNVHSFIVISLLICCIHVFT